MLFISTRGISEIGGKHNNQPFHWAQLIMMSTIFTEPKVNLKGGAGNLYFRGITDIVSKYQILENYVVFSILPLLKWSQSFFTFHTFYYNDTNSNYQVLQLPLL